MIGTTTAPAGNRDPISLLLATPGPAEISYGENVGYTASLANVQSSTFTKVVFKQLVPTTVLGGSSAAATLVYSSCEPGRSTWPAFAPGDTYVCPELAQLRSGQTAKVLVVWNAPGLPTLGDDVSCGGSTSCVLETSGVWTIKEGTGNPGSSGPDTFPTGAISTPLLSGGADLTKARGYVLRVCSGGSSLETSLVTPVGPANKLYTRVCASTVPGASTSPLDPGLVVEIEEKAGGPITEDVSVCIPQPGQSCAGAYTPWTFSPRATLSFTIDNTTLPAKEKIDKVLHDDDANGTFTDVTSDCVIKIVKKLKITNVTCTTDRNGSWRFG